MINVPLAASGNFVDGVRQGLITSSLNHVAHAGARKLTTQVKIDSDLKAGGLNPSDKLNFTVEKDGKTFFDPTAAEEFGLNMVENTEVLNDLSNGNLTKIQFTRYGTNTPINKSAIQIKQSSTLTVRQYALAVGHELVHLNHLINGDYNYWKSILPASKYRQARYYSEHLAYKWEYEWGGNTQYNAPHTPLWFINDFYKKSDSLLNLLR